MIKAKNTGAIRMSKAKSRMIAAESISKTAIM